MTTIPLAIITILWLTFAYKIYGSIIDKKIIQPDDSNITPAVSKNDGIDYCPTKPFILFGHHFSSIAGAGPIIGPVAAMLAFGWGVSFLWLLAGVVFIGAVHDYFASIISIRNGGRSIADVAEKYAGKRTRLLFLSFIWLALLLVIAVFGVVAAKTLMSQPTIVVPTFSLIFIAMAFGLLVNKCNMHIFIATVISLLLLSFFVWIGFKYPILLPFSKAINFKVWFVILMFYGLVASSLPVWILLQPRDYICNWILILGLLLGFVGLFTTNYEIGAPFIKDCFSQKHGPIWPSLFILIACGAISGFHSIVASGTTAKQIAKESHAKIVVFGGMLLEGGLAVLALLCVSAGLSWASGNSEMVSVSKLLSQKASPIKVFSEGYARFLVNIVSISIGVAFATLMLNAFVMTTLDTSVRLSRFIAAELFSGFIPLLKNRWLAAVICIIPAYWLGASGGWKEIWPVFGASNQLVAALALIIATAYLVSKKKPTKYTLIPAAIMLITSIASLSYQAYSFIFIEKKEILAFICIILLILATIIVIDTIKFLKRNEVFSDKLK